MLSVLRLGTQENEGQIGCRVIRPLIVALPGRLRGALHHRFKAPNCDAWTRRSWPGRAKPPGHRGGESGASLLPPPWPSGLLAAAFRGPSKVEIRCLASDAARCGVAQPCRILRSAAQPQGEKGCATARHGHRCQLRLEPRRPPSGLQSSFRISIAEHRVPIGTSCNGL